MASSVPIPNAGTTLEHAKITEVRQAWMQAVRDGDGNRLTNFVTDDVVAVLKTAGVYVGKRL